MSLHEDADRLAEAVLAFQVAVTVRILIPAVSFLDSVLNRVLYRKA